MDKKHTIEAIDPSSFDTLLTKYPEIVPQKLLGLDEQRYTAIPEAVQTRNLDKHLIKDDLVNLVDWKLYVVSELILHPTKSDHFLPSTS